MFFYAISLLTGWGFSGYGNYRNQILKGSHNVKSENFQKAANTS